MHDDLVYALSALAEAELHRSSTTLTPAELALLVRFDGQLTLAQVRATFPRDTDEAFRAAVQRLHHLGLLRPAERDPWALDFDSGLARLAAIDGGGADAGLAALQRKGFYVQIARESKAAASRPAGETLTALVIEDDQMLAHFTRSYLTLSGFQVRLAGNRAEVVAQMRQPPVPDLILLDLVLPDADGFDILLRVRQHPALKDVPVILLTGVATREAVIRGMAAGADGYVTKPFEPDALMQAVNTVLGIDTAASSGRSKSPWANRDALAPRPARPL